MKAEGRRRKAVDRKQKTIMSFARCLPRTAYCFLPATFYFFVRLPFSVSLSPAGRALLAAALLVSAYALVRYWRSLKGRSDKIRYALISLRALALVLVSCALAGVRVEYESAGHARVLLRDVSSVEESENGEAAIAVRRQTVAREQTIAALREKGFEVVETDNESNARVAQPDGSFVAGVLLTNGAMSASEARLELEEMNRVAGGAPVFVATNYLASAEQPSVALESVTVLGEASRGVPFAVRCTIHGRGMRGRESLLKVSDDAKVQASARVVWTSDDERQQVTLNVVAKVAGWIDYSAKVEAGSDEFLVHVLRPFTVYVEDRRLRVLFFESQPTWEAKFIRRALEQSGLFEVDYLAQVSRAAAVGISEETIEQQRAEPNAETQDAAPIKKKSVAGGTPEAKLHAALQSAAQLNIYDCVIVGATENTLLTVAESARLREWVERRGGGLIVLGGNSFNGSIVAPGAKLYSLLPTEISAQSSAASEQDVSRGRPLEAEKVRVGVRLTPTEAGASGALAGYLDASEGSATKADTLAGQGLHLGGLRPGGVVLAVAGQAGESGTSEAGAALIDAMRYGAGRTLVFAPADSWRLRTSTSVDEESAGVAFNALWQGLVLWTSAGAHAPVEIVLSDESPAVGSVVTAEIRARDASFTPLKIEKVNAHLQPLTEDTGDSSVASTQPREIGFAPDEMDKSVWRARFNAPARGRFVLEIDYAAGGKSASIEKQFAVVAASQREAGASLDTLKRVSRETGGELLSAADTDALVKLLSAIPSNAQSVRRTWDLRTWWPLALLVPLLLSTEWFLRRWWRVD
jgi:hypothetical protein